MPLTPLHRIKDAIRFKRNSLNSSYLILGGITPWPNEAVPPAIPLGTRTIPDAFCAAKCAVKLVYEDNAGIFPVLIPGVGTKRFTEFANEAAAIAWTGTIFVMLQATITDSDITGVSFYRKLGFSTDLVPASGHESSPFLSSGFVTSWGQVECLEYRRPISVHYGSEHNYYQLIQY